MMTGAGKQTHKAFLAFGILIVLSAWLPSLAMSGDYPRRIAIAPFVSLAKEDIQQTVSVLPRLLMSRLMAQAGAEVVLLPADAKDTVAAAREARLPLLLQGTVAKLGKGYSVDVTVLEPETGKTAGAFFTAAATEDEIIPQLGALSGDIAEKLFGVKQAPRVVYMPATPTGQLPSAAAPPAGPGAGVPPMVSSAGAAPSPQAVAASPGPLSPKEGWIPSSIKKFSQSDKILDEVYGIVTGDMAGPDEAEVIAYGRRTLYVYRIKGENILPHGRITRSRDHHIVNVDAFDIDGDGKKDLVVSALVNDRIESFLLKRKGDGFEELQGGIPHFLVVLPDWMGKPLLVGQRRGIDTPFTGRFYKMAWDGKTLKEGEALPADTAILPLAGGILGLSSGRFGAEWNYIYTDETERLRIVDGNGKSQYKSKEKYGSAGDFYEWGEMSRLEGKRPRYYLRDAARLLPGTEGKPFFVIPDVKRGLVSTALSSFDSSRLVILQWDGGELIERASTPKSDHFYSGVDAIGSPDFRKGGKLACSVIEQEASPLKGAVSRLVFFVVE